MSSNFDSYRSSSTASSLRTPNYRAPTNFLDLAPSSTGSERAEFHDRYQNRVNIPNELEFQPSHSLVFSMHGSKKITLLKLVHNTNH